MGKHQIMMRVIGESQWEMTNTSDVVDVIAQFENWTKEWAGVLEFKLVPPYTPPAITHEGELETSAGSPCGNDDILGVPPPC